MVQVFVPRETASGETRVAAVPETAKKLVQAGHAVHVEAGAGSGAHIADEAYVAAGAALEKDAAAGWKAADVVFKIGAPSAAEVQRMKKGALVVSSLLPLEALELVRAAKSAGVTLFSLNLLPRTTLAQKMDVLSSQANIAGYKAVLLAASALDKYFPMLTTAAGTILPARVVVMGAGVAGLQAVATAKRLGAVVEVSDIRPAVKEQVESLGAKFIDVGFEEGAETAGGYAKAVSEDFLRKQQEIVAKRIAAADVVITTALVLGKKAPLLVPASVVAQMREGSVIVDLAAAQGGNCELTKADQEVVSPNGVRILGPTNLAATVPVHASETFSRNCLAVLQHLQKKKGEPLVLDFADEIVAGSVVTHDGQVRHQPTADALAKG
jgi:NAD(P) transhydrogenase subunit alpha